jgi:hypothetical protein
MLASKTSRQLALSAAVGLAIEFGIMFAISLFIAGPNDSPFVYALIGLALLYAFRMANGLLNMILATALYYLTKRRRVSAVVAMFYQNKIPVNDDTRFADGNTLLEAIAASPETTPEAKRFALMSIGEFSGIRLANRPMGLMQAYAVMDTAWERYRSEIDAKSRYPVYLAPQ